MDHNLVTIVRTLRNYYGIFTVYEPPSHVPFGREQTIEGVL